MYMEEGQADSGVYALSLVLKPATKATWITLSEDGQGTTPVEIKFETMDEDKRIIMGPALIPNQLILRDQELRGKKQKFYMYLSQETVEQVAHQYLLRGHQHNATLEHQVKVEGVTLVETWLKTNAENDKSNAYKHLEGYPVGTWFVALKIQEDLLWDEWVKTGKVKGISIEGNFADRLVEMSQIQMSSEDKLAQVKALLEDWKASKK